MGTGTTVRNYCMPSTSLLPGSECRIERRRSRLLILRQHRKRTGAGNVSSMRLDDRQEARRSVEEENRRGVPAEKSGRADARRGPATLCSFAADTMPHPRFRCANAGQRTVHVGSRTLHTARQDPDAIQRAPHPAPGNEGDRARRTASRRRCRRMNALHLVEHPQGGFCPVIPPYARCHRWRWPGRENHWGRRWMALVRRRVRLLRINAYI